MSINIKMIQKEGLVFRNRNAWEILASHIEEVNYSNVFIIVDENTQTQCLPRFYEKLDLNKKWKTLQVSSGEKYKNIESCIQLWERLSEEQGDRNSLIINLGGGMITDLGGFVASTFKRGMAFVNIPTTLLAMVDASIGGKNGIDFGMAKNQIGTINLPIMVVIENLFLETLPKQQLISGMAEMLKHSLIHSSDSWDKIRDIKPLNTPLFEELIWESIAIKSEIVSQDPLETGLRKTLNYGHTLGHAIESHCLDSSERESLLHGEAIAIGMILATYISNQLLGFPEKRLTEVSERLISLFPKQVFSQNEIENIINLLVFDKKNRSGKVLFVLMQDIGELTTDCVVSNDLIYNAFEFYKKI